MDRRLFLKSSGLFVLSNYAFPKLLTQAFADVAPRPSNAKVLVVIFQRGAVDGLAMVPPIGDSYYTKQIRPTLHLGDSAIALDGLFGLNPALAALGPFWNDGRLAVIHEVGSPDATRSHFDAQDFMESGTPGVKSTEDGFLNRALLAMPVIAATPKTPLKAVAVQPNLPRSLWGSSGAIAMNSIKEFSSSGALTRSGVEGGFESLYDSAMDEALKGAGQETFAAIKTLGSLPDSPAASQYPKGPLGKRLAEIAKLIRGQVGVRLAVTDCGGWDTHQHQGGAKGQLATRLQDFSGAIAAFANDLGPLMNDVCLVTITEFGRTVKENGNGGTDHGHGSVMFVLGGNVRGKRVVSNWKSLAEQNLYEGRDLPVTTDFRDIWSEILEKQLGLTASSSVFPGFWVGPRHGLFRS